MVYPEIFNVQEEQNKISKYKKSECQKSKTHDWTSVRYDVHNNFSILQLAGKVPKMDKEEWTYRKTNQKIKYRPILQADTVSLREEDMFRYF